MSYILGLGGPYYHDGSACLIDGSGNLIAFVEEERFTRRKHNKDSRSCTRSAAYCLTRAGIRLEEVDEIAVGWNPYWPAPAEYINDADLIQELLHPTAFAGYTPSRLRIIGHHLAHAASAFYPSGFAESAVLVVDGSGDGISTSIFHGTAAGLELIRQFPFSQSLGWFYETAAEHLGLGDWTSSGKLMGLAAYGRPRYSLEFLRSEWECGYLLDLSNYGIGPEEDVADGYADLSYYRRLKQAYAAAFTELGVPAHSRMQAYDVVGGRMAADTGFTQDQADLAASVQSALERSLLHLAHAVLTATGSSRLCIAGGVGLNCSANGVLHRQSGAKHLFVQPVSSDAGCAIGAAMECARQAGGMGLPAAPLTHAALGAAFTDEAICRTLDQLQIRYTYLGGDIANRAAQSLIDGSIIGWFQGPCEAGPRALGHRSILADPRNTTSRDRINRDIKRREMWRPLAPSILSSAAEDLIVDPGPTDFMIVAYEATDWARSVIPATIHVDGSLRPQTVSGETNGCYADLIAIFGTQTGVPALLNTSFNHEDEPIVCTPTDAVRTFFSTPLDALALGGCWVTKE